MLQRSADKGIGPGTVPPVVHDVLQSSGQPLESSSRAWMEPRFGYDFSRVRVHTDSHAARSATAVNALAYTVGQDVVFAPRQYSPQTDAGRRLLAHELTHVVQQSAAVVGHDAEAKAEHAASLVARGETVTPAAAGGAPVSLQKLEPKDVPAAASHSTEPPVDEFEFDKSNIPPQHIDRLTDLRAKLIRAPGATVVLTGHTDTVGQEQYNKGLGLRRAEAVRDLLTKNNGVNTSRITVESMGELTPAAGQPPAKLDPEKGQKNAKNRRVEIQVIGLPLSSTPSSGWSLDPSNPTGKKQAAPFLPSDLPDPRKPLQLPGVHTASPDKTAEGGGPTVKTPSATIAQVNELTELIKKTADAVTKDTLVRKLRNALAELQPFMPAKDAKQKIDDAIKALVGAGIDQGIKAIVEAIAGKPAAPPVSPTGPAIQPKDLGEHVFKIPPIPISDAPKNPADSWFQYRNGPKGSYEPGATITFKLIPPKNFGSLQGAKFLEIVAEADRLDPGAERPQGLAKVPVESGSSANIDMQAPKTPGNYVIRVKVGLHIDYNNMQYFEVKAAKK